MDVERLHECFLGSLQADPNIRGQSETQLKAFSGEIGFSSACLDIISNGNVQPIVKTSCSIYLKNIILRNWTVGKLIDTDERPIIRERLLVIITKLDKNLRNQLLPALSLIIKYDYPKNWPELLNHINDLISNNLLENQISINNLYIGIYSFTEICRNFRWRSNQERSSTLDPIINNFFPIILNIGNQILNNYQNLISSFECSEILKLIIKCYKFVTYLDFPLQLQSTQLLVDWITFQVNVINTNFNEDSLPGWIKSQKWCYHNLYRLFQRYGTKSLSSKFDYSEFRHTFKENVLPNLINVYIENLKNWSTDGSNGNGKYLSNSNIYYLIEFLEQCLLKKDTFKLIEPHFELIIGNVSFKIFNPTDEDLELFEDEPEEYIHKIFDIMDENTGEDALHSFFFTLVEKRVDYLVPMFQFVINKFNELNNQTETIEIAKGKESLMKFLSPISYKLSQVKNPVYNEVEPFLNNYIIPNFQSNFPFLRARTCNLISKFDSLDLKNFETINNIFNGIINNFLNNENNHLPIEIQSALSIQTFIVNEEFKKLISGYVLKLMEKLMNLSNKFDSDILPSVMQELVESFPEQLEPFAEQLMEQLSLKLITLLNSINEITNNVNSNEDYDYDEFENLTSDKTSTALGILNTMITILLYFENSTEIIDKLEIYYSKVIKIIFDNKIEDFYAEAGELIENTLFLTRKVSPIMWSLLNNFINTLLNDEDITLYLEDSLPALKNYLIYGGEIFQNNNEIQELFFKIILTVFQMGDNSNEEDEFDDDIIGFSDIGNICDLTTTFILSLNNSISGKYLPIIISYSIRYLKKIDNKLNEKGINFKIQLLNTIISSIIIDPNTTMKKLIEDNSIEYFLTKWFNFTNNFKRVFDMKLSILGYISILSIDLNSLNNMMLTNILSTCGNNLSNLLFKIPTAIKELEKRREEYTDKNWENELTYKINEAGDDDDDGEGDEGKDFDDEEDDEGFEYSFDANNKFSFDEIDELVDDPYSNNSLDKINIFEQFKSFIINIQTNEVDKYNLTFNELTNSDKETLTNILNNI